MVVSLIGSAAFGQAADEKPRELRVHKLVMFVCQKAEVSQAVIRSEESLAEAGVDPAELAKLGKIDFAKQMVVVIHSGMTNAFGTDVTILSATAEADEVKIRWQFKPYFGGAAPPDQPGNPSLVAIIDAHPGKKYTFERTNWRLPDDVPPPPSAPPAGGGGFGPLPPQAPKR